MKQREIIKQISLYDKTQPHHHAEYHLTTRSDQQYSLEGHEKISLDAHYRLSDIHHILRQCHPTGSYHIKFFTGWNEPEIFSYSASPNELTIIPPARPKKHQLRTDCVPNLTDQGEILDIFLSRMEDHIRDYYHRTLQDSHAVYNKNTIYHEHVLLNALSDPTISCHIFVHQQRPNPDTPNQHIGIHVDIQIQHKRINNLGLTLAFSPQTSKQDIIQQCGPSITQLIQTIIQQLPKNCPNISHHQITTSMRLIQADTAHIHHELMQKIQYYHAAYVQHYT